MTSTAIVNKVWNFCHTLRDDGVGYGDYLEQLTYLLFLKMADEQTKPPFSQPGIVPEGLTGRRCWSRTARRSSRGCEGLASRRSPSEEAARQPDWKHLSPHPRPLGPRASGA